MGGVQLTPYGVVKPVAFGNGSAVWLCKDCSASSTATTARKAEVDLKRHHKRKHKG